MEEKRELEAVLEKLKGQFESNPPRNQRRKCPTSS